MLSRFFKKSNTVALQEAGNREAYRAVSEELSRLEKRIDSLYLIVTKLNETTDLLMKEARASASFTRNLERSIQEQHSFSLETQKSLTETRERLQQAETYLQSLTPSKRKTHEKAKPVRSRASRNS